MSNSKKSSDSEKGLAEFEKGLALLYDKKWKSAEKVFRAISAKQPRTPLAERAQRYIEVCESRSLSKDDGADAYVKAIHAKNNGDLEAALDLCSRGLKGRDERFAYLAAAIEGLQENHDRARELLEKAIEMNAANRVHAFHDPDFQSLRDDPASDEIFAVD